MKSEITERIEKQIDAFTAAMHAVEALPWWFIERDDMLSILQSPLPVLRHVLQMSEEIDEGKKRAPMIVDAEEVRPAHIDTPVIPNGTVIPVYGHTIPTQETLNSYKRAALEPIGLEGEDWPFRKNSDMQQYKHVWKNILTLWLTRDVMLKSRYPELFKLAKDKGYTYDKAQHFTILESKLPDDRLVVLTQMYLAAKRDEGKEVINDVSPLKPHEKELKEFIANRLQGAKDLRAYPLLLSCAMKYDATRPFNSESKCLVPEVLLGLPIEHLLKMYDALMKDEGHA